MNTSKGERLVRRILERRYNNMQYNVRPETLINPKTGRRLELDIYMPKNKLAFEFQGSQHSNHYQSFKDEVKKQWCHKNKIHLRVVWAKGLIKLAKEYGLPEDDELMIMVAAYVNKCNRINKKGGFKTKANKHAKRKAKSDLAAKHYEKLISAEGAFQRYRALIKSGKTPAEAKELVGPMGGKKIFTKTMERTKQLKRRDNRIRKLRKKKKLIKAY